MVEENRAQQADLYHQTKFVETGEAITETRRKLEALYAELEPMTEEELRAADAALAAESANALAMMERM